MMITVGVGDKDGVDVSQMVTGAAEEFGFHLAGLFERRIDQQAEVVTLY